MNRPADLPFDAIVVGCSAGGLTALHLLLAALPTNLSVPVLVVVHVAPGRGSVAQVLRPDSRLQVFDAADKMQVLPGNAYIAAPDYHLLVGSDGLLCLCVDEKVCHSRPSIDVLFESAAGVWRDRVIGVILTGANRDGAEGLRRIRAAGGIGIVQDPGDAEVGRMPEAAIAIAGADYVAPLGEIPRLLTDLVAGKVPRWERWTVTG